MSFCALSLALGKFTPPPNPLNGQYRKDKVCGWLKFPISMPAIARLPSTMGDCVNLQDHPQITVTTLVAFGLSNPSMSVPYDGEWAQAGSLAQVIHVG